MVQFASNPFRCETPRTFRQCGQKYTSRLVRNEDDSTCASSRSNSFSQYGQIGRTSSRSSTGIACIENSPYILSPESGVAAHLRRRTRTTQRTPTPTTQMIPSNTYLSLCLGSCTRQIVARADGLVKTFFVFSSRACRVPKGMSGRLAVSRPECAPPQRGFGHWRGWGLNPDPPNGIKSGGQVRTTWASCLMWPSNVLETEMIEKVFILHHTHVDLGYT